MIRMLILVILMVATEVAAANPQKSSIKNEAETKLSTVAALPEGQVVLDGKPLFVIKGKVYSFSPEDRAKTVSSRLDKLAKDPLFKVESLKVVDSENTSDIIAGELALMSVTEGDAKLEGKPRLLLAEEYAAKIRVAVEARNNDYSTMAILFGTLYSLLATMALMFLLFIIKRYHPKILQKVESLRGTFIRSVKFQSIEVLNEDRIVSVLVSLIRTLRAGILVGLFYLYIPLVLSFFPWTRGMANKLFDYILTPIEKVGLSFVSYLPNIFFLLVITVITHYSIKLTRFVFTEIEKQTIKIPGFYYDWAVPSFKIARFLIIAFAAVVAFPYLPGSDSPAFKGVSVFLGVLFSLGSSSAISNIVAGVILTYMRAFKLGDRVKIADTVGDVVEKNLLVTRIRTIKNVDVTVPNAMVLGSHITNFSSSAKEYGLILHTTVTIGYDAPWRQVHELLIAAAKSTENILNMPKPFVLQTSLDDFYVSYQINAYTEKPSIMARTYSELHQNIQEQFNQAGIEIMSPHYSSLRDGNHMTIPESYLPGTYKQPAFKVSKADVAD